ncbi:hypothetical protein JTE90_027315 [Oedothorax gibbosus]|uniref:Histone H2A n=1 Tax=Oedothorax gibbosus TaxID=931172 RepID=A0AAV6VZE9_9ARAC|nr:hypothetical protein JTE90_027315 [Oedothorax gibbosus]
MHDFMSQNFQGTVKQEASSFLSTAIGYIGKEIMELSVNAAITRLGKGKDVKVTLEDVQTAINSDEDLKKLMDDSAN